MSPSTEQELLDCIVDLATWHGWRCHHDRPARTANGWRTAITGHAGFPDLVLSRAGVTIFRELKGPYGRMSREQRDWGDALSSSAYVNVTPTFTVPVFAVWRPVDWDHIVRLLTAKVPAHA